MTDPPIEDLEMTDEEYAHLLTQGYDPELERQLIALGEHPSITRKMTRFFGLLKGKTLETQEEQEELSRAWTSIWATNQIQG